MNLQDAFGAVAMLYAVANLASMGLELEIRETLRQLRSPRLLLLTLLWTWVIGPAAGWLIVKLLPLAPGYTMGLIIFSLAPTAPALPLLIRRAKADMSFAAALMPLAVVGTVVMMPLLAPLLIPSLTVSAWAIAKPLLLTVLLPLVLAVVIKLRQPGVAAKIFPAVKKIAGITTLMLLVFALVFYMKDFIAALGSFAIAAQVSFILIMAGVGYCLSPGYNPAQRSSLALGVCSRNGGAMFVAITAFPNLDPKLMLMIVLAVPVPFITWLLLCRVFASRVAKAIEPTPVGNTRTTQTDY